MECNQEGFELSEPFELHEEGEFIYERAEVSSHNETACLGQIILL